MCVLRKLTKLWDTSKKLDRRGRVERREAPSTMVGVDSHGQVARGEVSGADDAEKI